MSYIRPIECFRFKGKQFVVCPECGTFMDEPSDNNFKCPVPDCDKEFNNLPVQYHLMGDWKFRVCGQRKEGVNIAAVNLKTGAIGRVRIPFHIFDDPESDLGQTMEEVIERFGRPKVGEMK